MTKPRHEHDCNACVPLGEFQEYDLYFCPREPTVIARYGPDGDYTSGLCFAEHVPALGEAKSRAVAQGLIVVRQSALTIEFNPNERTKMIPAPHALVEQAKRFALMITDLEIADADNVKVIETEDTDYPAFPNTVRVEITTFAPQKVTVIVGWLDDLTTPHYFVNWSAGEGGDFCCHEGTPSLNRALFNLGGAIEQAASASVKLQKARFEEDHHLTPEQLREKYTKTGSHPDFPIEEWRNDVYHLNTIRGYWDWAGAKIDEEMAF